MRKRVYGALLALGTAGALVAVTPGAAFAGQSTATANLSAVLAGQSIGSRTIAAVTPGSFSSVLGNASMSSPLATEIAETAVSGDANWSVTGAVSDFSDGASHTITGHALNNSGNTMAQVLGGGTVTPGSGTGDLGTGQTFFTNTGQNTSTLYTGTYTNSSTLALTPPNGTYAVAAGTTYTATLTVTLFT